MQKKTLSKTGKAKVEKAPQEARAVLNEMKKGGGRFRPGDEEGQDGPEGQV